MSYSVYIARHIPNGLIKPGISQSPVKRVAGIGATLPGGVSSMELLYSFPVPSVNATGVNGKDFPGDTIYKMNAFLVEKEIKRFFHHLIKRGEWFFPKSLKPIAEFLCSHPMKVERRIPFRGYIGRSGYQTIPDVRGNLLGYWDRILPATATR